MPNFRTGDTVIFNDAAWSDFHESESAYNGRTGVLRKSSSLHTGTWLVYFADEDCVFHLHETWLLPIFVIEETP